MTLEYVPTTPEMSTPAEAIMTVDGLTLGDGSDIVENRGHGVPITQGP